MRNIGIITKLSDPEALKATKDLAKWLYKQGCKVAITQETAKDAKIAKKIATPADQEKLPHNRDLVVVIGGDGTFIAACRAVGTTGTPLLGINMGRLGFLTEVTKDAMLSTMAEILDGRYTIEKRMLLAIKIKRKNKEILKYLVLNDAVIHKGALARMLEYEVAIDKQFVFSSRADGLIISSPTGSTAYSLSAGGPIIHPTLNTILLVPICPHTLTNRPIAVPGDGIISITLSNISSLDQRLTLDGQTGFPLQEGDKILIKQSKHQLHVLHAADRNYYSILREKLRWGEQVGSKTDPKN
ncbi:MAG: NAD(+)/NADH kinase [Magnetococcales bacterium]|nr:NAD(+)/NADH kinase [Magnetococcales bacterium]